MTNEFVMNVEKSSSHDRVSLRGPFNEEMEVHLDRLHDFLGDRCTFDFAQVTTINSSGVRVWISFLRRLQRGRELFFEACTPDVVAQLNMIPSFRGPAEVLSAFGPYYCEKCRQRHLHLFEVKDKLPEEGKSPPPIKCPDCQKPMVFEEYADEYFQFARS